MNAGNTELLYLIVYDIKGVNVSVNQSRDCVLRLPVDLEFDYIEWFVNNLEIQFDKLYLQLSFTGLICNYQVRSYN